MEQGELGWRWVIGMKAFSRRRRQRAQRSILDHGSTRHRSGMPRDSTVMRRVVRGKQLNGREAW
jgi:hypothetical protein